MKAAASAPAYVRARKLRGRLAWCASVLLLGGAIGYVLRAPIIALLQRPLGQDLFNTSPAGNSEFIMRVCFLVGLMLALPVMVYHVLRFIEPALPKSLSRRLIAAVIVSSIGLMTAGVALGYFVSLPAALYFFNDVDDGSLNALITADKYFNFVVNYLAIFAAVFQLPLVLIFINRIKPLRPRTLQKYRKFVITGSFIMALFVPAAPNLLSQTILALPIIILYEASIWLIWATNRPANPAIAKLSAPVEAPLVAQVIEPKRPAPGHTPAPKRRPAPAHRPAKVAPRAPQPASQTAPVHATARPADALDLSQVPVSPASVLVPPAHIIDLRPSGSQ